MDDNAYSPAGLVNPLVKKSRQTRVIKSLNPFQLGKMLGILYALISLLAVPIFLLGNFAWHSNPRINLLLLLLGPVFYGGIGTIIGLFGGVAFNACAAIVGGIEVEIE